MGRGFQTPEINRGTKNRRRKSNGYVSQIPDTKEPAQSSEIPYFTESECHQYQISENLNRNIPTGWTQNLEKVSWSVLKPERSLRG
jgi:hypothetical protein